MRVWRICRPEHASTALSGEGAAAFPGRWNFSGERAVYAADCVSLAMLEILANAGDKQRLANVEYIAFPIEIDEGEIADVPSMLPKGWNSKPPSAVSRQIGSRFLHEGRAYALRVPSAIVPSQSNFVLNPAHPSMLRHNLRRLIASGVPVQFDERMLSG